jgi:hypothetical protein
MGVVRPEFINEPTVFQPLPHPAAVNGGPERRFVHRGIEIRAGRLWGAGGVKHQVQRGEDQVQSGFRLAPQRTPAFVKRLGEQRLARHPVMGVAGQLLLQGRLDVGAKRLIPQILTEPLLICTVGRRPWHGVQQEHGWERQLALEMVHHA